VLGLVDELREVSFGVDEGGAAHEDHDDHFGRPWPGRKGSIPGFR
jgi:hypothetical protein